jgi:hypothetical protein
MTLPLDSPTGLRAKVVAISPCLPPWTVEVEIEGRARAETIWFRGYHVGQVIRVERRPKSDGTFWADIENPGGGCWTE